MRSLAFTLTLLLISGRVAMAQTNVNYSKLWFDHAPKVPELNIPSDLKQWEQDRVKIRAQLWKLLGDLPLKPNVPEVKTISRQDRGDYIVEKFQFDNGAGAT